jgi:hypothetical protein
MAGWRAPADGKRLGEQMSKKIPGLFVVLALFGLSLLVNCGSSSSRPAGILYVLSQGENNVGFYSIDLGNGKLSLINNNASTCATASTAPCGFPEVLVLDPAGSVAFVLDQGVPSHVDTSGHLDAPPAIHAYSVKSDGTLTESGSPQTVGTSLATDPTTGDTATAMARDAGGTFLFAVSQGATTPPAACGTLTPPANGCPAISVFSTQSGSTTLTPGAGSPFILSKVPTSVAAVQGPNGNLLLYVTSNNDLSVNDNDNTVSEYSVDAAGHVIELTAGGSPYTTGSSPSAVLAVQTTPVGGGGGLFVYVANGGNGSGGNSVSIFQVCTVTNATCTTQDVTNATMLPVGTPVSAGLNPVAMTIDPTNNFLYVVNHDSSSVSGFRINPTTGALTATGTVSTGSNPVGVSIHPDGLYLFVSNNGGSTISGFNLNTTSGALSNAINVTSSAQPAGLVAK